jgi:hypothetical protein
MRNLTDNKLKELERELAERIVHLAAFLDKCFNNGKGNEDSFGSNIIKYIDGNTLHLHDGEYDQIDLNKYRIGRSLPYYYDYAYKSKYAPGIGDDIFNSFKDNDEDTDECIFKEFLELTDMFAIVSSITDDVKWGISKTLNGENNFRESALWKMSNLFDARHRLYFSDMVTIADIVLLTNMNEKSIRNALRDEGENKLNSRLDPKDKGIDSSEALRWMRGRKSGFRETTVIDFEEDKLPEYLLYIDIGPFIKARLEKLYGRSPYTEAAERLGYIDDQLDAILDNIDNLPNKDTHRIAKVIQVDPAWFTEQVFTALFPEQMELILYRKEIEYNVLTETEYNALTDVSENPPIKVTLTEKGIKNGYIDIPAKFSDFFPKDSFAERATGTPGKSIELRFGNEIRITEMRVKSSITISPRARFGGYLNNVINAKPGDTLEIIKVEDRAFEIKHSPSG